MLKPSTGGRSYGLALIDVQKLKSDIYFRAVWTKSLMLWEYIIPVWREYPAWESLRLNYMSRVSTKEESNRIWWRSKGYLWANCYFKLLKAIKRQKKLCRNISNAQERWWTAFFFPLNFGLRPCIRQIGYITVFNAEDAKIKFLFSCVNTTRSLFLRRLLRLNPQVLSSIFYPLDTRRRKTRIRSVLAIFNV